MQTINCEVNVKELKSRIKRQNKNYKPNIFVLCGGKSFEHDISILTAQTIANAILPNYNANILYQSHNGDFYLVPFDLQPKNYQFLDNLLKVNFVANVNALYDQKFKKLIKVDLIVNCSHGQNCEDGTLTHLFNLCNIVSTSGNATSQAITLDKEYMKDIFVANNIPTPKYYVLKPNESVDKLESFIKYPIIVKPANLGSSIGICVCENLEELNKAINFARKFDEKIILEEYLDGVIEVNCACMMVDNEIKVSKCEMPKRKDKFLSFSDKYISNEKGQKDKCAKFVDNSTINKTTFCHSENDRIIEDEVPIDKINSLQQLQDDVYIKIQQLTKDLYKKFDCEGVVRIDYLIVENKIYVNEINTIPGSLAYYLFEDKIEDFVNKLMLSSYRISKNKSNRKYKLDTKILG